jgi:hydrogenase maturation protease
VAKPEEVLFIAVGNPIVEDDGIGPYCLERLLEWFEFPPELRCIDEGDLGLSMLADLPGTKHLVVIDAMQGSGHEPGTVMLLTPEELAGTQVMHTAHDMRLVEVLRAAALTDQMPETTVVAAMEVVSLRQWEMELTPLVKEAAPILCAAALDQLRRLGIEFAPKEGADIPAELLDALENFAPETED